MLQIRKLALVKLKLLLIRKEITELYRICDMQRFQIAVTALCRQLQSTDIYHSIKEMMLYKVDKVHYVCNSLQRVEQDRFNLNYQSMLFLHTDVNLTLS